MKFFEDLNKIKAREKAIDVKASENMSKKDKKQMDKIMKEKDEKPFLLPTFGAENRSVKCRPKVLISVSETLPLTTVLASYTEKGKCRALITALPELSMHPPALLVKTCKRRNHHHSG